MPDDQVWDAVLKVVAARASLSWIHSLAMNRFDGRTAVLTLLPGQREMRNFVTGDRQRTLLADLFRQVLGRPVRVEIDAGSAAPSPSPADAPAAPRSDRDDALAAPLVRQVLQIFEASLVATRSEEQPAAKTSTPDADESESEGEGAAQP